MIMNSGFSTNVSLVLISVNGVKIITARQAVITKRRKKKYSVIILFKTIN